MSTASAARCSSTEAVSAARRRSKAVTGACMTGPLLIPDEFAPGHAPPGEASRRDGRVLRELLVVGRRGDGHHLAAGQHHHVQAHRERTADLLRINTDIRTVLVFNRDMLRDLRNKSFISYLKYYAEFIKALKKSICIEGFSFFIDLATNCEIIQSPIPKGLMISMLFSMSMKQCLNACKNLINRNILNSIEVCYMS